MLSEPVMYAPPPRRAELESMNLQLSTVPLSPVQKIVPPSPPKYSSVTQSIGEGPVSVVNSNIVHSSLSLLIEYIV